MRHLSLLRISFFISIILLETSVWAQSGTGVISGVVVSEDAVGHLADVQVQLAGTAFMTISDKDGRFVLSGIPVGSYTLSAHSTGYEGVSVACTVKAGAEVNLRVVLSTQVIEMPQITILEDRKGIFATVPGSVTYLDKKEINRIDPVSGNEVLRRSPGLHVVDEEGAGLRINIGVRGLDPDRSRSVLVMEDGIPVALAPYGEPEMYYTPAIDRMAGVEVIKGSGSIMYGPQTIGGVVNYITADPPAREQGTVSLRGGNGGFFTGAIGYGNTYGKAGIQVNYLRKQVDDLNGLTYRINDLSTKLRLQLTSRASLGIKLSVYDEESNATYVGITQTMFDQGGQDFVRLAPDDLLAIRRYSLSATHKVYFNENWKLATTAFGYTTTRNWRRQDFGYNANAAGQLAGPPSNHTGVTWGDESVAGGAIYMRKTNAHRNRAFEVAGIESRLTGNYFTGEKKGEISFGMRALHERAFEQRVDGTSPAAVSGTIREDEIRTGIGLSGFVHNRLDLNDRFSVTAGVRIEQFGYTRDIRRGRYNNVIRDTSIVAASDLLAVIPGAGFNFRLTREVGLFGGIHRGFAPPRVKDAISGDGTAYDLAAELSWNTELGMRGKLPTGISYEFTAFFMDFSNQVIPVSESSGGQGAGLVNGGATRHYGAELGFTGDVHQWLNIKDQLIVSVSATYVEAHFSTDRFVGGNDAVNISGNRTPYAPKWNVSSAISFESRKGFGARLTSTYITSQFADILNTVEPDAEGRIGMIPAYHLLDGGVTYRANKIGTVFSVSVKNITDERYLVSRRPQGIRVGMPRFITAGVRVQF